MTRRGALSLSMNTIVVIVIGVTVLSLGLIFVQKIFFNTTEQLEISFTQAQRAIEALEISHDQKLTAPITVKVRRGDQTNFDIWVVNQLDNKATFEIELTPSSESTFSNNDVLVAVANRRSDIGVDQEAKFVAGAKVNKQANLDSAAYELVVTSDGEEYARTGLFIEVES